MMKEDNYFSSIRSEIEDWISKIGFSRRIFFVYREANMYEIKYQRPHSQKAVMGVDIGF